MKKNNILEKIAHFHMMQIIKKRPLDMNIETINKCPLKCVFCCNRIYQRDQKVMDNQLFEHIVKQYYEWGGGALGICAMQSDIFSDPLLVKRMKILKKYKDKIWLYTTTSLISCKKYSDDELLYMLRLFDYLQISVEGYDRETYKTMGGIDGFDTFKEQLVRIKKMTDMYHLNLGIGLYFRTFNRKKLVHSRFYRKVSKVFRIDDIKDTFFSWFGSVKTGDLPEGAKVITKINIDKKSNCSGPSVTLAVMADGKVVGCGCIDWLGKYVIGDCRKNTLKEIWWSEDAVKFRNAFEIGSLPTICKECGLYAPLDNSYMNKKFLNYRPSHGLSYIVTNKKAVKGKEKYFV